MREWKIICDHCGVEISGNPFQSVIEHVGRETDAPVINQKETFTLDLCEACVDELRSWKMVRANTGILSEKEDKPDPADHAEQIVNELFKDAPESADPEEAPEDTAPPLNPGKYSQRWISGRSLHSRKPAGHINRLPTK